VHSFVKNSLKTNVVRVLAEVKFSKKLLKEFLDFETSELYSQWTENLPI